MRKMRLFKCVLAGIAAFTSFSTSYAQAPQNAPDVMLQGFYWDSNLSTGGYGRTKWADLQTQVDEISETFDLIWLPPSAKSEGGVGYHPKQWCNQSSEWGNATLLKTLISSFKANGTRCVADIVINHKSGNSWLDLDNEDFGTYGQFTLYEAGKSSYICSDDEASAKGYKCLGNKDAGYETLNCDGTSASGAYCAARDLDHSNTYLQSAIKAYLQWMKGEMGFDGWRYDLVKGYLGKYTKMYNEAAGAYMSVGEYWDGSYDAVKNWVNETGKTSMAFDFPMKYAALNNGLASNNYSAMASGYGVPQGLCGADEMKRYSVTFVDNHDTFRDGSKFTGDWTKANAYILSAPGIPCVFYPHWVNCKEDIKKMVAARKACGIHSQSACTTEGTCGSYYKCTTTGTKGKLICFIGGGWSQPAGYTLACSGSGWAYYTNVSVPEGPVVTMTPANGYVGVGGKVTLSATKGTIYYTTDGTTPSASSTKYTAAITISTNKTTIKAIAIDGSSKSEVVSGTFLTEKPAGIVVKFKAPASWSKVNLYSWDDNDITQTGAWPGTAISKNGDYYEYTFDGAEGPINVVFNNGTQQTADLVASEAENCWDASSWSGTDTKKTPATCGGEEPPTPSTFNIFVKKSGKFASTAPYVYCWGGYANTWPGELMVDAGNGYWAIKNKCNGTQNIIFNDGNGNQTGNIEGVKAKTCYEVTNLTKGASDATVITCPASTAIEETDIADVTIYPNPVNDIINISAESNVVNVIIRDLGAQIVLEQADSNVIDVTSLISGMYFATIELENEKVVVRKIIKK